MRNVQKILIGVFVAGVVLGGIGTGIALEEFSGLRYGGRTVVGEEHLVTRELDFHFPIEGKTLILGYNYNGRLKQEELLVEDITVPVGTIRYEVTYNEQVVKPFLQFDEYEEEEVEEETWEEEETKSEKSEPIYAGILRLRASYIGNGFELFMENKDRILEELRQKKLSSYELAEITNLRIRVNPETMKYIEDGLSSY